MATNDFVPFATGGSATVLDQADWLALLSTTIANGFTAGIADPATCNKLFRQSSFVAAAVAQLMCDTLGINISDDGNLSEFEANLAAVIRGGGSSFDDTGAANAYVITPTPAATAYTKYQSFTFLAAHSNTGASTLNVNGLGAKTITRPDGSALQAGDILAGQIARVTYNGTSFQMGGSMPTGRLLGIRLFAAPGTSTYTPTAGTTSVVVQVQGGGAGGGGAAATGASSAAVGGGGGAGGFASSRLTSGFSGVSVTVGAGGSGGAAGNNPGAAGGTSSFGALLSATGGSPGAGAAAATTPIGVSGGQGGFGSSGNLINSSGQFGGFSTALSTSNGSAGAGGSSAFGGGAQPAGIAAGSSFPGVNASSPGSGGSGAANGASLAAAAGGAGAPGIVVVYEYA